MLLQAVNFTGYRLIRRTLATSCNGKRNAWWPKCAATPSPRKIGRPVKIAFWPFLFTIFSLHVAFIPGCMLMFKVGKGTSPGVLNSLQQKFRFDISLIPHAPMEWCTPVAQTQPKPQHVNVLVSRIQKSSTRDNNFVRWSSRDILVWPTKMTRPVKVDYLESWSRIFRSDQTEMDHSIWSNQPKLPEFWVEWK